MLRVFFRLTRRFPAGFAAHVRWPLTIGLLAAFLCGWSPARTTAADSLNSEERLVAERATRLKELPAAPQPPAISDQVPNPIDRFIAAAWQQLSEMPRVHLCDDATYLRRVHLDVIGVIPTYLETNHFLASSGGQQARQQLVDELLAHNAEYAAHWTPFWEDALASQNVLSQGGILTRGNYRDWLVSSFERNRPFDVMVAELIDPTMPGRKGANAGRVGHAVFDRVRPQREPHRHVANGGQYRPGLPGHEHEVRQLPRPFREQRVAAGAVSGVRRVVCAHDLEKIRCELKTGQTVPAKFPFELPGRSPEIPADLDARLHLTARLITDPANSRFAETIVNRLWKRYFGLGLREPVDDFREDVPASHPELLEWLAHDFVAHGSDLKHTIRLILTSQTYQLRYDGELADYFRPGETNEPRYFRSPSLRRLSAEQLLDSIRLVTTGELTPQQRTFLDMRSTALMRALGRPASRNEISTSRPDDVAVVQSLELLNGGNLHEMIYNTTAWNEAAQQSERRLVDRLYRTVLSRPATVAEKNAGRVFLQSASSPEEAVKDILWALVCSPEFQYIQ